MQKLSIKNILSLNNLLRYSTLIAFVLVIVVFSVATPIFLKLPNIVNILSQASMLALVAIGLCFIVVIGGVDLSIAASYGIGGLVAVSLLKGGMGWIPAIVLAILAGVVFGCVNAFLVVKARISVWLATLGTLFIGESLEKIMTRGGTPIYFPGMDAAFKFLGRGSVLLIEPQGIGRIDLKFSFALAILIAVIAHFVLEKTTFGRSLYAFGTQKEAASLSGIPVNRYTVIAFIICSVSCVMAGMIGSSVLTAYVPVSGRYYLMDAIGAVFIGSTLNRRGFANIPGTLVGVLFFGVVSNGLNLIGINFYWQAVARGLLIFIILALDSYRVGSMMKLRRKN